MASSLPHAVVLGLSPTGLYVARELGELGVPLLGVDKEFTCGSWSRHFRHNNGVWRDSDSSTLLSRLIDFAAAHQHKPVLIPTSDYYIDFVIQNHIELAKLFQIAKGYRETAASLLDKLSFYELCKSLEIPCPGVWQYSEAAGADQLPQGLTFPCILKPTLIHRARPFMQGKKVLIVEDLNTLSSTLAQLPTEAGSWLIQEIIPGEESSIMLLAGYAGTSEIKGDTFTARKLRQFPCGFGSASRAISERCEEAERLTLQLIDATGFEGIYGSEFKLDPRDGMLKIIEVNPRPTLWFQLSHAAGKHLVERAYCDLSGRTLPARVAQRNGVVWQYLLKDLASALFYRLRGGNFLFPAPDLTAGGRTRQRCWPVFSLSDPLPAVAELLVYATKFARRIF